MFRKIGKKYLKLFGVAMSVMVLVAAVVVPAGAAADLRTALQMNPGADSGVIPGAAHGDVRFTAIKNEVRVGLDLLDPARFPAGCLANVTVGKTKARSALVATPAIELPLGVAAATSLDFAAPGPLAIGQKATVNIKCEFVNATGLRVKSQTSWSAIVQ